MSLRILLADDHQMFRHALRALLARDPELEVVAEAASGEEVLAIADAQPVDLVCMDIAMPGMDGIEATRRLLARHPALRVIGLSAFADRQFVTDLLAAGARGYITKGEAGDELLRAIRTVCEGRSYLCPEVAATVAHRRLHGRGAPPQPDAQARPAQRCRTHPLRDPQRHQPERDPGRRGLSAPGAFALPVNR